MNTLNSSSLVPRSAPYAALFDLDGVIINTEPQYTVFWNTIGEQYCNDATFAKKIKGRVLTDIFSDYFANQPENQNAITDAINRFESNMIMEYVPGVLPFFNELRHAGFYCAIVTSSNRPKMESVYKKLPELRSYFDAVLTGEMFTRGKPEPECYILGSRMLHVPPERCVVFEDSLHGLTAGRKAHMHVVGLATTLPAETISTMADIVIPDFNALSVEILLNMFSKIEL